MKAEVDFGKCRYCNQVVQMTGPASLRNNVTVYHAVDKSLGASTCTGSMQEELMKEYISLGSAPYEESCAQLGTDDYTARARKECSRFIELIRKKCGPERGSASLRMKGFNHDFGIYYEVICEFDVNDVEGTKYAYEVEANIPDYWE